MSGRDAIVVSDASQPSNLSQAYIVGGFVCAIIGSKMLDASDDNLMH